MKICPHILIGIFLSFFTAHGKTAEAKIVSEFALIVQEAPNFENRIISTDPSKELIESTIQSLEWSELTNVVLRKSEKEKVEISGRLDLPRGLRMIVSDSSGELISNGPPVTLKTGSRNLQNYLSGNHDWKDAYEWKKDWKIWEEFDYRDKDWWFLMELSDLIGCYFEDPKTLEDYLEYLPGSEEQYGWCCTTTPVELKGEVYQVSSFSIVTPDYIEAELYFEFLMDIDSVGIERKKIHSTKIYTYPKEFPSGIRFYLLENDHEDERFLCSP